jgi:hypothetical protein
MDAKIFVQITAVRDIDIRGRECFWKNSKGKKPTTDELHSSIFFMGTEDRRKDLEKAAAKLFMGNNFLAILFQSGAAVEVCDRERCFMGMKLVRSMINSDGSVTFQTSLFPTGAPG